MLGAHTTIWRPGGSHRPGHFTMMCGPLHFEIIEIEEDFKGDNWMHDSSSFSDANIETTEHWFEQKMPQMLLY